MQERFPNYHVIILCIGRNIGELNGTFFKRAINALLLQDSFVKPATKVQPPKSTKVGVNNGGEAILP